METAGGEMSGAELGLEDRRRLRGEGRDLVEPAPGNLGVGGDTPGCGDGPGRGDALGDNLARLARGTAHEMTDVGPGDRQAQVEAVEERPRQPAPVPGE